MRNILMFVAGGVVLLASSSVVIARNTTHKVDMCRYTQDLVKKKNSGLIAIVNMTTKKKGLYSSSVFYSKDCKSYQRGFSTRSPDVVKSKKGFCMVLPGGEIKPGLQCLKSTLCLTKSQCVDVVWKLKWNAQKKAYIKADPAIKNIAF